MTRSPGVAIESRCEFCRCKILWAQWMPNPRARTDKGPQYVPIDPEPSADQRARLALTVRTGDRPLVGEMTIGQATGWRAAGKGVYIQHAKTCARAKDLIKKLAARNSAR
jgi:hypothetical protein